MRTATRLSAYGAALVVLAGCAFGIGSLAGTGGAAAAPAVAAPAAAASEPGMAGHGMPSEPPAGSPGVAELPAGLASSRDGYTLTPAQPVLVPGAAVPFSFTVTGPDGAPVTAFDVEHEKRLHLIVVRRDTAGFQHVHPEMAADGTWTVPLGLPAGGSYRAFADFTPTGGPATTLGVDLSAPGGFVPATYAESRTAHVDGFTVDLAGDLVAGQASPVTLTVSRDGRPVTDLQPYLGAYGHLVALRTGDLAYLHVHPQGTPGDGVTPAGPQVRFAAEVPSAGTYRLFLDFRHDGVVRTAEFTVTTSGSGSGPAREGAPGHGH